MEFIFSSVWVFLGTVLLVSIVLLFILAIVVSFRTPITKSDSKIVEEEVDVEDPDTLAASASVGEGGVIYNGDSDVLLSLKALSDAQGYVLVTAKYDADGDFSTELHFNRATEALTLLEIGRVHLGNLFGKSLED